MGNDKLDTIKRQYRASFDEKAECILTSWRTVESAFFASGQVEELRSLAHKLAGSSGMYGYTELSQCARDLERALAVGPDDTVAWRTSIKSRVMAVVTALREHPDK